MTLVTAPVVSLLVTMTLMVFLRPLANSIGLVDRPGGRKTHNGVVPVIGGIAMLAGLLVAVLAGGTFGRYGTSIVTAASLMVLIGALDDRFDINPVFRLFAQTTAGVALVYGTGFTVTSLGNLLGFGEIALGVLALPFTIVACMALINAFNMLDGLDGLAGGTALVAFGGLAWVALSEGAATSSIISLSLLGSVAGFLFFNMPARFNRSVRAFMGDAGSTLLGFVLACVGLLLIQPVKADLEPIVVLWMMPIPIFELFTSFGRRLRLGLSPMQADNGHFHHRLLAAGFSVRLIFAIYIVFSAVLASLGLWAHAVHAPEPVMAAGFLFGFVAWLGFIRFAPVIGRALPVRFRRDLENVFH